MKYYGVKKEYINSWVAEDRQYTYLGAWKELHEEH